MQNRKIQRSMLSFIGISVLCVMFASTNFAQVPKKINYQGFLKDSAGNPVNSSVQMEFALYDVASGGTALWSETRTVTVMAGNYSVDLGAVNPINLTQAKPYWLGVKVGTDPEMTPRKELTSAMYALLMDGITVKNGNVGIGVTNPGNNMQAIPTATGHLDVAGNIRLGVGHIITNNPNNHLALDAGPGGSIVFRNTNVLGDPSSFKDLMIINGTNGYVGIGTTKPDHNVTISSSASENTTPMAQMNIYNPTAGKGQVAGIRFQTASGWNVMLRTNQDNAWLELTGKDGSWRSRWVADNYYVKGTIYASGVTITNPVTFPDFVFDKTYQLMSLSEVEQHIAAEKHLPGVPSAQEIEQNGVSLGDMQAKQLQKIEELTLYVIQMNKQLTTLQQENESLKTKLSTLEQAVK